MIVTGLLCLSLALIIYSAMKGRKMMSVLLKFMLLSMIIIGPVMADDDDIGMVGIIGIPEPHPILNNDPAPILISIPDATNEMDSWTAGALAFLNGNETIVISEHNNTTLVIA
jgi:hypothetical protein